MPPAVESPTPGRAGSVPPRPTLTARRRVLAALLTLGVVGALGLAAIEVGLRLFAQVTDIPFVFWDPLVGLRRRPDQVGRYVSGNYINAAYRFNKQGWNHPRDYAVTKPPGARRVCLIGDSQVEAIQVDPEQGMYSVAERRMSRPDRPVEWYAFGSSGLGTSQEHEVIRHYVLDYRPDVVVLLFIQNDPFDASPYIVPLEPYVTNYYLDDAGELVLIPPRVWEPTWYRRLSSKSALVRYFMVQRRVLQKFQNWGQSGRQEVRAGGLPLREEVEGIRNPYMPGLERLSMEQRQQKTWELIGKLLEATRDECARRGARFAVAFRGWGPEIEAPVEARKDSPAPKESDPYCLGGRISEMGREQVQPLCERLAIPYLDLTDALRAAVERAQQSHRFPDDNHFNANAHQAAGEALADWVETFIDAPAGEVRAKP